MRKVILSITGIALFGLLAIIACNSTGGGGTGPGTGGQFKIHGIFVRDANSTGTKDKASFQLRRNDTLFNLVALTIDTFKVDTSVNFDTTYYRQSPPDFLRPGESHSINLTYAPNSLNFTTSLLMPDTFSFIITSPATHVYRGSNNNVQLLWTGSGGATGYLLACVNDSAGKDTSFFATGASIPREAFRNSADQVVEGLYKIYVIAFKDGIYPYSGMPFPYPSNYTPVDITYSSTVGGRITAAFVARIDTIRATTQP